MDSSTRIIGWKLLSVYGGSIPKIRKFSEISVEGYDTWLQNYATELTLRKHFASCGEVLLVSVFKSFALMRFEGEDAKDKALQLSGTDVGGWIPIVKAAPWQREPFDYSAWKMKSPRMFVSGYDTRLPEIDVQIALCEHFSSCGDVTNVTVFPSRALIMIRGERCEEKALDLNGSVMGGMNLVVEPPVQHPASRNTACNYMLPSRKLELEERKKKKMEKEDEEEEGEEDDGEGEVKGVGSFVFVKLNNHLLP